VPFVFVQVLPVVKGRCLRAGESVNEVNADDSAPEAVPGRRGGRQRAPGQGHAPAVAGTVEATHIALCPSDVATLEAGYNLEFLKKYLILGFVCEMYFKNNIYTGYIHFI